MINDSFELLTSSYKKELKKIKRKDSSCDESNIYRMFSNMRDHLFRLPIVNCAIEINSNNFIKIFLSFSNDKLLMLTKQYIADDEQNDNTEDIIYSYFIDRKLIASDVTNFKEFIEKFKEYIA